MNFLLRCTRRSKIEETQDSDSEKSDSERAGVSMDRTVTFPTIIVGDDVLRESANITISPVAANSDIYPEMKNQGSCGTDNAASCTHPRRDSVASSIRRLQRPWIIPHTRIVAATTELFPAMLTVNLETVSMCKVCGCILEDIPELVESLMKHRVKRVLIVTIEGQGDCLGCCICSKSTLDEDAMRTHLLEHIQLNEVTCDCCLEDSSSDSSSTFDEEEVNFYPEKNLETVMITQLSVLCQICNKSINTIEIILSEAVTIQELHSTDTEYVKPYKCVRCGLVDPVSIAGIIQPLCYDSNINIICDRCKEIDKANLQKRTEDKRTEADSATEKHTCPRHIVILNMNSVLRLRARDFIIDKEDRSRSLMWYTCRFCGESMRELEKITSHARDHISRNGTRCKECQKETQYVDKKGMAVSV